MQVLVLEASTTAAKALVHDSDAGAVAFESENYGSAIDAGGLHDASKVVDALLRAGRKIAAGRDIAAVALAGVWHSLLACDGALRPVTPTYLWNFTGTAAICARVFADRERARAIHRATGCMPNITYQPYSILHMRENGLDPKGKKFISQAGLLFHRLTGEHCETRCITSGMGLLNLHSLGYDEGILDLCGLRAEQFGRLTDYRDVRPLTDAGAAALGIAPGIPVVPQHADGALNQLGNGAMRPGHMTFSVGTSAAIRLSTARPVLSDPPATWCYVGVEGYMSGAATNGACNCVNWLKERVLGDTFSYTELESTLLDGGDAPIFLPFLFGERCPGWDGARRGGFRDVTGADDAAALFRAVAEGVLFNVYQCYRILTAGAGDPERIILSGGILHSPKWTRMAADIFRLPMRLSDNPNASMLGGAALAQHAAGGLKDLSAFGGGELETVSPGNPPYDADRVRFARYLQLYEEETKR